MVGRVVHEMTSAPIAAEQHKYLIKRQIDDDNKDGKMGFISNKMGQMIRNKTVMDSEWDMNLIVRVITDLSPQALHFPSWLTDINHA